MTASPQLLLLLTRLGFGAFIALWGLNKIIRPESAQAIFGVHYGIEGLGLMLAYVLGVVQTVVGGAIILGLFRTLSYGLGLAIHGAGTLATLSHYVMPFAEGSNLVFWASVPVLLGALGLFLARRHDTFLSLDAWRMGPQRAPAA